MVLSFLSLHDFLSMRRTSRHLNSISRLSSSTPAMVTISDIHDLGSIALRPIGLRLEEDGAFVKGGWPSHMLRSGFEVEQLSRVVSVTRLEICVRCPYMCDQDKFQHADQFSRLSS